MKEKSDKLAKSEEVQGFSSSSGMPILVFVPSFEKIKTIVCTDEGGYKESVIFLEEDDLEDIELIVEGIRYEGNNARILLSSYIGQGVEQCQKIKI